MYIIVYTSMYTSHCTYDKVRRIKKCHVYLLVYTIMYMLYSSHIIICTVSCITTGIYNDVHALFFSHYHMYHVMYSYIFYILVVIHDTVHMIMSE
jgi:hypothetical protein